MAIEVKIHFVTKYELAIKIKSFLTFHLRGLSGPEVSTQPGPRAGRSEVIFSNLPGRAGKWGMIFPTGRASTWGEISATGWVGRVHER